MQALRHSFLRKSQSYPQSLRYRSRRKEMLTRWIRRHPRSMLFRNPPPRPMLPTHHRSMLQRNPPPRAMFSTPMPLLHRLALPRLVKERGGKERPHSIKAHQHNRKSGKLNQKLKLLKDTYLCMR